MTTAGDMLAAEIRRLAADVTDRRAAALADEPDAVHQLRTTVRRLRNLLAAFRRCFDPDRAAALGAALASYGDLLGECRDLEVRAADTNAALDALGLADELGDALVGPLVTGHAAAHDALVAWHAGPGVTALDALLATWADAPALARRARRPAAAVAQKAVRRQARRVLARADAVVAAETGSIDGPRRERHQMGAIARRGRDGGLVAPSSVRNAASAPMWGRAAAGHRWIQSQGVEEARHGLRKAGRRLRHTADAVAAADLDDSLQALGRLGHQVQGALGDHRDALLLADHVRRCADGLPDGADRTSYDALVRHAEELAAVALAGLDATLSTLREKAIP